MNFSVNLKTLNNGKGKKQVKPKKRKTLSKIDKVKGLYSQGLISRETCFTVIHNLMVIPGKGKPPNNQVLRGIHFKPNLRVIREFLP